MLDRELSSSSTDDGSQKIVLTILRARKRGRCARQASAGGRHGDYPIYPLRTLVICSEAGYCAGAQALAARGEPLLSGFETAPADFAAYWRPHGWSVAALLDAKCVAPRTSSAWTWGQAGDNCLGFYALAAEAHNV